MGNKGCPVSVVCKQNRDATFLQHPGAMASLLCTRKQ